MRYSPKEMVVLAALAEHQGRGVSEIDLDDIIESVRPTLDPNGQKAYFRSGILSCIRNLRLKLPEENLTLTPNNEIGRGNKSSFRIEGNYKAFLDIKALEAI